MSIAISNFADITQIAQQLQDVSGKTQISLGHFGVRTVAVGRFDRGQAVRSALLESLNNTFGEGGIPKSVLDAMNVDKAFSGFRVKDGMVKATNHPLTARRLKAITDAVADELAKDGGRYSGVARKVAECGLKLASKDVVRVAKGFEQYDDWVEKKVVAGSFDAELRKEIDKLSPCHQLLFKALAGDGIGKSATVAVYWANPALLAKVELFVKVNGRLPDDGEIGRMHKEIMVETARLHPEVPVAVP